MCPLLVWQQINHDLKNRKRTNPGAKKLRRRYRNILSLVEGMLIRNGEICKNATMELVNMNIEDPLLYEFPIWVHLGTSVR